MKKPARSNRVGQGFGSQDINQPFCRPNPFQRKSQLGPTAMRAGDAVERRMHPRSQFIGGDRSPRRPTAQTSIEAIMHSVRTRGIAGLKDPETLLRVKQCDENALKQIAERIAKLGAANRIP
jgi:hypothetical protein